MRIKLRTDLLTWEPDSPTKSPDVNVLNPEHAKVGHHPNYSHGAPDLLRGSRQYQKKSKESSSSSSSSTGSPKGSPRYGGGLPLWAGSFSASLSSSQLLPADSLNKSSGSNNNQPHGSALSTTLDSFDASSTASSAASHFGPAHGDESVGARSVSMGSSSGASNVSTVPPLPQRTRSGFVANGVDGDEATLGHGEGKGLLSSSISSSTLSSSLSATMSMYSSTATAMSSAMNNTTASTPSAEHRTRLVRKPSILKPERQYHAPDSDLLDMDVTQFVTNSVRIVREIETSFSFEPSVGVHPYQVPSGSFHGGENAFNESTLNDILNSPVEHSVPPPQRWQPPRRRGSLLDWNADDHLRRTPSPRASIALKEKGLMVDTNSNNENIVNHAVSSSSSSSSSSSPLSSSTLSSQASNHHHAAATFHTSGRPRQPVGADGNAPAPFLMGQQGMLTFTETARTRTTTTTTGYGQKQQRQQAPRAGTVVDENAEALATERARKDGRVMAEEEEEQTFDDTVTIAPSTASAAKSGSVGDEAGGGDWMAALKRTTKMLRGSGNNEGRRWTRLVSRSCGIASS